MRLSLNNSQPSGTPVARSASGASEEAVSDGAAAATVNPGSKGERMGRFAGKMGVLLFLFFLVKGLLWLIVPAGLAWWAASSAT